MAFKGRFQSEAKL